MNDFLYATAWKMKPPEPYSSFHLIFFTVGLILSVALAWRLRKTTEKQNRAVLLTIGLILLISEIYKQLFYTFVLGGGEYQWWIFPFQLCSIPMYLCLIIPFLREGKLRDAMYDFMLAFNLMGGFISFFEPSGLIHDYWTLTLHAFTWHMILVFIGFYIGFSGRAGRRMADFKRAAFMFLCLCVIAFAINLIFFDISGGTIKMFYVGPAISPIAVFKSIATEYGWYVNTPIYIACLTFAAFVFYAPFAYFHSRAKNNLPRGKKQLLKTAVR